MTVETLKSPVLAADGAHKWWHGAVIYQVYPRSFADSNGDGVGDLAGVTAHLDHIASLGVDAVWLSPFFTSPMKDFGYDIADFCDVDPIFGTLADFDVLIARAHELGLKVVIDQVYSHTSDQHAWFAESRSRQANSKADWYVWADAKPDGSPPNNWQSVFGGPSWTWDGRRRQYYLHNFLSSQPDLNVHHPEVQEALLGVARFWLDRGVDGFRLDAINFSMHDPQLRDNPPLNEDNGKRTRSFDFQQHIYNQSHPDIPKFLGRLRALLNEYEDRFTVAEVGGEHAEREMKEFTSGDALLNTAYGFTFLYADALTPRLVRQAQQAWPGAKGEGWPSWAFSNHDAPRHVSRWAGEHDQQAYARLTLMLLMCLRGNAFLYYGEELGLPQAHVPFERLVDPEAIANWPGTLGRDGARTPMPWVSGAVHSGFSPVEPWLPVDPAHDAFAVDVQEREQGSTLQFARQMIAMRKAHAALRTGQIRFIETSASLLVFERIAEGEALLCVFNLGEEPVAGPSPDGWGIVEAMPGLGQPGDPAPAELPALGGYVAAKTS